VQKPTVAPRPPTSSTRTGRQAADTENPL
jgi:hypothetical protein